MEFNPGNPVVQLCIRGMEVEEKGELADAGRIFLQAWNEATYDFEKFIAAYYVARTQKDVADRLKWLGTALHIALKTDDKTVKTAFATLYSNIAKCHQDLGNAEEAKRNDALANSYVKEPADKGPFYHGTKAALQVGDMLTAGRTSNYDTAITMNHIYFTALMNGAGLAAELAKGDGSGHVYIVEPTGGFENDPNVTDKKFPGNPTRSYRTSEPLKIIGEVTDWVRMPPEALQKWRERLANNKEKIIN